MFTVPDPSRPRNEASITLGAGLANPCGRRLELDADDLVDDLARAIRKHEGREAWWSASSYTDDRRRGESWSSAAAIALDLDYQDAAGKHAPIPVPVADEAIRRLSSPNLAHTTPRGMRAIFVLTKPVSDPELYARACRGAAALVESELGDLIAERGGLVVDPSVTGDLARLLFTPRATVNGTPRSAEVVTVSRDTWDAETLAAEAPAERPHRTPQNGAHAAIAQGSRNATLTAHAGALRRRGASQVAIEGALLAMNDADCEPPLPADEVRRIAQSLGRYEPDRTKQADRPRFSFIRAADLEVKAAHYLVHDLLETDCLALGFADPGAGKSFWALDLAAAVATGRDWHGRRVKQGPVLVIIGEGRNGYARRLKAWESARGVSLKDAPLLVSTGPADLTDELGATHVIAAIADVTEAYGAPVLVIIDTVARSFGGGNENSTEDMGRFVRGCDAIRAAAQGATVLLIHHTGHSDKSRARGASALFAALDASYRLERGDDDVIRLECTKTKDAPTPDPLAFRLRSVTLPASDGGPLLDEEGREVTSAVLDMVPFVEPPQTGKAGKGKWQTVALECLERLQAQREATLETQGGDPSEARVFEADWRDAMRRADMPRQRIGQCSKSLIESGRVIKEGFHVHPA